MYLTISLYEFGQFLRIVLWIFIPVATISMLVTTYLHYRRKRSATDEFLLAVEGQPLIEGIVLPSLPVRVLLSAESSAEPEPEKEER